MLPEPSTDTPNEDQAQDWLQPDQQETSSENDVALNLPGFAIQTDEPVAMPEEQRSAFKVALRRNIEAARSARGDIETSLKDWRSALDMRDLEPPYEGAPNIRTPTTRGRTDAVRAQIRGSLDIDPFFSATPLSDDGAKAAPAFEATMENELRRSHSRKHLFYAASEGIDVGTGVVKLGVRQMPSADPTQPIDYMVVARAIPLERWFPFPTGTDELEFMSCYEHFVIPVHVLRNYAKTGRYDPVAAKAVEHYYSVTPSAAQESINANDNTMPDDQERVLELYECWTHWNDERWMAIYHYDADELLVARQNPYPILDSPPYFPVRPLPRPDSIFGDSLSKMLKPFQDVNDAAFNSILAMAQMLLSPPMVIYDDIFYRELEIKSWEPGARFKAGQRQPYEIMTSATPQFPIDLLKLADQQAEQATFSNMQIPGLPIPGRRTAYETQIIATAGMAKLRAMFLDVREDLNRVGEAYWKLIASFRVQAAGVLNVYAGYRELSIAAQEITLPSTDPQTGAPLEIFVPSAFRQDLRWETSGGDTKTEKQMRIQNLQMGFQFVFPILQYVSQDVRLWNWAKQMLDNLDIPIWRDLIGEPPTQKNDQAFGAAMQQMQQMQNAQNNQKK